MTILVTGATGFLGSYLIKSLLKENYKVIIIIREKSKLDKIKDDLNRVTIYNIDHVNLNKIFKDNQIHKIIHLATCYGRNDESNTNIVQNNLLFPLELLELASQNGVNEFYYTNTLISSFISPYALSKSQFKDWGYFYSQKKKIKFINIGIEHLYGPLDDDNKFVNWVLNKLICNEPEINFTSGKQERDFIYITDAASALIKILNFSNHLYFDQYEVGSGENITIKNFVLLCKEKIDALNIINSTKLNFGALEERENEQNIIVNLTKLSSLGWEPKISINQGIDKLVHFLIKTNNFEFE